MKNDPENIYADSYFIKAQSIVKDKADSVVVYAVFLRRPVISAPRLAIEWLEKEVKKRSSSVEINTVHPEGSLVGAGEVLLTYKGKLSILIDLETEFLQKIGSPSVAAYNTYSMVKALPKVSFIAMDARHCAGRDMMTLMAYGASIGSNSAKKKYNAVGFIGNSNKATANFFGNTEPFGTMSHSFVGYAGSTLKAAQLMFEKFPKDNLTVLIDYFGKEISEAIEVASYFKDLAHQGRLSVRLDTHSGRFLEGLELGLSYQVINEKCPEAIQSYRTKQELKYLVDTGVSAAAIWYFRAKLDEANFQKVKIIASGGFSVEKCRMIALTSAPVDIIGTGSFIPELWSETFATADIISYDGNLRVKLGREFLQGM